jgi:hypothetical protein
MRQIVPRTTMAAAMPSSVASPVVGKTFAVDEEVVVGSSAVPAVSAVSAVSGVSDVAGVVGDAGEVGVDGIDSW